MQTDTQSLVESIALVIGVVVWLVRLEGRINTQSALYAQMREDVTYIRERIDAALNGHS